MSDSVLTENLMEFLYGIDGVIGFKLNNNSYYYKKNLQGDIIGIYNSDLQLIAKYAYDAWGNHKISYLEGSNFVDFNNESSYTNISNNNLYIALKNPFRYRSYYYDQETSLYYLNSRYYDPRTGRFINVDDISVISNYKDMLNGLNLYIYCNNNPVMLTDETGYGFWDWLLSILLVGAVIAIVIVSTIATGGVASTLLISAGIGAFTSGVTSTISQLATTGSINGWALLTDVLFGALTGVVGGSVLGIAGSMVTMGMSGVASSITGDLVQGKDVNYGKALFNGLISMILGASAGAQNGLTSQVKNYKQALSNFQNTIQTGQYSLRGANGTLNLAKYRLMNSINYLKIASKQNLYHNWINSLNQTDIFYQLLQTIL